MSTPIDPADIRVGDTVERVSRTRMVVSDVGPTMVYGHISPEFPRLGLIRTGGSEWELIDRPAPKPEVGQHWLDTNGNEYVVAERVVGLYFLIKYMHPVEADVAPAGWTLKP